MSIEIPSAWAAAAGATQAAEPHPRVHRGGYQRALKQFLLDLEEDTVERPSRLF
jgi:hypothetical protein